MNLNSCPSCNSQLSTPEGLGAKQPGVRGSDPHQLCGDVVVPPPVQEGPVWDEIVPARRSHT